LHAFANLPRQLVLGLSPAETLPCCPILLVIKVEEASLAYEVFAVFSPAQTQAEGLSIT